MSFSVVPTPSLTFGFQPEIQSCSTFIDGIVMSQRFRKDSAKQLVGLRSIAFRQPGDIRFDGTEEQEQDVMPEKLRMAWIHG